MALALPNLSFLNSQMSNLGKAVKQAGPSLFSATQTAGPDNSQRNSMMTDFMDTQVGLRFPTGNTSTGNLRFGTDQQNKLRFPGYESGYGSGAQSSGPSTSLGGDWAGVDQWSSTIDAAAAKYGLDPNMIKAVMKLESGGDPNAAGADGVWGPMQVNSKAWGNGDWMTDPNANIFKGAEILKHYMDAAGGDFREALRGYHGYGSDGFTTDNQYADMVMQNYSQLQNGGYNAAGYSNSSLGSVFQNGTVPEWGEFGAESSNGYYSYGSQYGMNGTQHTGVDVPMPVGSSYRAPMGGTVTCAGTGNGSGADGSGCAAFGDYYGNGAGRVEVLLDNGTVLIFGHSSTSALRPGQRFNAGDVLGTSGGMNSPHIHLEARVRDSSTPSGWRIVDPRSVLGGGGGYQSPYGNGGGAASSSGDFLSRMRALAGYR